MHTLVYYKSTEFRSWNLILIVSYAYQNLQFNPVKHNPNLSSEITESEQVGHKFVKTTT